MHIFPPSFRRRPESRLSIDSLVDSLDSGLRRNDSFWGGVLCKGLCGFVVALFLASPVQAAGKLKSETLIKLYKQECNTNMGSLKAQLRDGRILIRGTKKLAAVSPQLACRTDAKNPTIRQLNNKKWLASTEKFIAESGVDVYTAGARKGMATTLVSLGVATILANASTKGVSEQELVILGNMTRAVSFTEAHVKAAQMLFKKK